MRANPEHDSGYFVTAALAQRHHVAHRKLGWALAQSEFTVPMTPRAHAPRAQSAAFRWIKEHSLTLTTGLTFLGCWLGQIWSGHLEFNEELARQGAPLLSLGEYIFSGHMWEATFENWESEFLQIGAFVTLTVFLVHKGSAESRRIGTVELSDADPRRFADAPGAPWPVRRGGWILRVYEYSLGLAFGLLFLASFGGHSVSGWRALQAEEVLRGELPSTWVEYITSAGFWFESLQNWQSEFLAIGAMVWLSVYLRQRGSPESKPVHAPHDETGR
jgi:hypothetical protein